MYTGHYRYHKHCRWCGISYHASKPREKDGFHNAACKQAHHRAYKKWVTRRPRTRAAPAGKRVTQKKAK